MSELHHSKMSWFLKQSCFYFSADKSYLRVLWKYVEQEHFNFIVLLKTNLLFFPTLKLQIAIIKKKKKKKSLLLNIWNDILILLHSRNLQTIFKSNTQYIWCCFRAWKFNACYSPALGWCAVWGGLERKCFWVGWVLGIDLLT